MVSTNELKNGMAVVIDKILYTVIWFQHVKPGKGGAFVKTKLKNIKTGGVVDKTFRAGEELERAYLEQKPMEYLYQDAERYWFMNVSTYEQHPFSKDVVGEAIKFLKENTQVKVTFYNDKVIGIELPTFIELKVVETEPGFKGNTVTGGYKPASLETGAIVQVPLFIKIGDCLKIDTRTGEYIQRV